MSDSTKKILFKNSNNNNITLKIGIHSILQYFEENKGTNNINNKKSNKKILQIKKINNKKERLKLFTPNSRTEKNLPVLTNSTNSYQNKYNINSVDIRNNKKNNNKYNNNHHQKANSFILENKKQKRNHSSEKQENNMGKLKNINNKILSQKESKIIKSEINKDINNVDIANNNDDYNEINNIKNDLNKYIDENNTKINNIDNIDDMIIFTNNNIKYILDHHLKSYDSIKNQISMINNKNNQYIKVKQKLNQNISKKNQIMEKL